MFKIGRVISERIKRVIMRTKAARPIALSFTVISAAYSQNKGPLETLKVISKTYKHARTMFPLLM